MNWLDLACLLFTLLGMAYTFSPGCCCFGCPCHRCAGDRPRQVLVVIDGVDNVGTCADCPNLNGSWVLDDCCTSIFTDPATQATLIDPEPPHACHEWDGGAIDGDGIQDDCIWSIPTADGPVVCGLQQRIEFTVSGSWQVATWPTNDFFWGEVSPADPTACAWDGYVLPMQLLGGDCDSAGSTATITSL